MPAACRMSVKRTAGREECAPICCGRGAPACDAVSAVAHMTNVTIKHLGNASPSREIMAGIYSVYLSANRIAKCRLDWQPAAIYPSLILPTYTSAPSSGHSLRGPSVFPNAAEQIQPGSARRSLALEPLPLLE